jgi:UDP-2-acetamido-3-amino-2,3-dideoxy-glucuronate N-acetyltransferase
MPAMIHPAALCESDHVGDGTRVWAFAHILPGARVGCDCNLCDGVFVEGEVVIGDRVTVKCGVQLWDGVTLEDDVFVGPNATFTNDQFPRSGIHPKRYARTVVRHGASIGANATILPGLVIGANAMVGAGAVVTRDVPTNAIVVGNPARVHGYASTTVVTTGPIATIAPVKPLLPRTGSTGARLLELTSATDMRGSLVAGEVAAELPFVPARFFVVYDVPSMEVRGEHAHRLCEQVLVCLSGSVKAIADVGGVRSEFKLDRPDIGLYMPSMTWGTQYRYTDNAVLLVLASLPYQADDYIRDYDQYLSELAVLRASGPDGVLASGLRPTS